MKNLKDTLTNMVAVVLVVFGAAQAYLDSLGTGEINWLQLGFAIAAAIIAYFTGKGLDGKKVKD